MTSPGRCSVATSRSTGRSSSRIPQMSVMAEDRPRNRVDQQAQRDGTRHEGGGRCEGWTMNCGGNGETRRRRRRRRRRSAGAPPGWRTTAAARTTGTGPTSTPPGPPPPAPPPPPPATGGRPSRITSPASVSTHPQVRREHAPRPRPGVPDTSSARPPKRSWPQTRESTTRRTRCWRRRAGAPADSAARTSGPRAHRPPSTSSPARPTLGVARAHAPSTGVTPAMTNTLGLLIGIASAAAAAYHTTRSPQVPTVRAQPEEDRPKPPPPSSGSGSPVFERFAPSPAPSPPAASAPPPASRSSTYGLNSLA